MPELGPRRLLPARHLGSTQADEVGLARFDDGTAVLGPGIRAALWVQGCAQRCKGCVVPESHPTGGVAWPVDALVERLLALPEALAGVTFSGGEPMLQAPALAAVIRAVRADRPAWTFMSYTGYRHEVLRERGSDGQRALLAALDLLVDGPYLEGRSEPLLWRGSDNQRVIALTPAGRKAIDGVDLSGPWGTEYRFDEGVMHWVGRAPAGLRAAESRLTGSGALTWTQQPSTSSQRPTTG